MTANVITYRGRSAAREVGKTLGLPADTIERLSQLVSNWEYTDPGDSLLAHLGEAGCDPGSRASSTSPGSGAASRICRGTWASTRGAW